MQEIRTITLNNQLYTYTITYKNIKNCYLKVEQGQIKISCSRLFEINKIEQLIRNNQAKIIKQLNEYQPKYLYQDKGYVDIFNKRYQIVLKDLQIKKCAIHDDKIYVYDKHLQQCIEQYLKQILYNYLETKIQEYLKTSFQLVFPEIEIKKLKRRWGACFYQKNKLSFNQALIHLDYQLIDYVIIHELCHFIEANHSKAFYLEIEKRLPDYKERERKLKEISI